MNIDLSTSKAKIILLAVAVAIFGLGYWAMPTKTVIKTETKEVIKEVVKIEYRSSKKEDKNKSVVIIEVTHPDGTKTKETRIIDKGVVSVDVSQQFQKELDIYKQRLEEKIKENQNSGLYVGAMIYSNLENFGKPELGAIVTKRVIGAITAGAFIQQNRTTGITLGVSF